MTARLEGEVAVAEGAGEHEGIYAVVLNGAIFADDLEDAALVKYLIECIPDTLAFANEQVRSNKPIVFKIIDLFKWAEGMRERHAFSIANSLESHGGRALIEETIESSDSPAPALSPMPECRVCGCNDLDACFDVATESTCSWTREDDVCSFCSVRIERDN
jgi:hypothetical protein